VADALAVHEASGCLDVGDASGVALAATDRGWIVAVDTTAGVDLFPLDGAGALQPGRRRIKGAHTPFLGARRLAGAPIGGPLLVVSRSSDATNPLRDDTREATLLRADATEEHAAATVPVHPIDAAADALFLGDAFLYAE